MGIKEVPFSDLLSEVIDNRGKTCPTVDTGIPLIATNCIRNEYLYPTYDTVRFVSQHTHATWFRGHPRPGDIIFVNKATPGRVCLVPDPVDFCIAQDMVAVRANPERIYPKYLFAALRSPIVQERIAQMHVGTLIPHFKKGDFDKLLIPVPSREDQTSIGDVYFNLSAKIELNRRMNETLEAMARAIFKSWFVDFDPVRAKMRGEQPAGLAPEITALFPDALVETELGEAPEGWRAATIGDLAEIVGGSTPSTKEPAYWQDGVHCWATPKDLSGLSVPVLLETERRVTDAGLGRISSGLLPVGTVLLSSRAPIGYLAIAEMPVAINQGFIALKPKNTVSNLFLLLWCSFAHDEIVRRANGSTFLEIGKASFRPIPLVAPSLQIMAAFERLVRPIYERIIQNERASRSLAALRDTLLPKLISGELRVADAERIVGKAA